MESQKKLQFCLQNLGFMLEFKYIKRGLLETMVMQNFGG